MKIRRKQREKRTHAVKWGILVATAALCFVGYWGVQGVLHVMEGWTDDLPSIADTDFTNSAEESVMYASDGSTRLAEFQLEKRDPVTIDQISPFVLQGTVDTEDVRFYEHNGVDIAGIARAVINNITGGQLEGASTITQQLVRNTILTQEANEISIERKIREAELATEMEKQYSKDDILLMYLNTINYGDGCYGIEAAAQNYFQVSAAELTLVQAATLVGIPQSPTYLNPKAYPEACLERRNTVLDRLLAAGHISQEEHDAAQAEELALNPAPEAQSDGIYAFPYFTSYVRAQLFADDNPYDVSYADLFEGGLTIYTSLDPELQQMAEDACADQLDRMSSDLDCSLVAVDTETGQVKAMVGGKDYSASQVNLATGTGGSGRMAGSTFKAFTLAAAIEQGIDPDTPIDCTSPLELSGGHRVENFGGTDYGIRSIQSATAVSSNTGFVRLSQEIHPTSVTDMAERLGIPGEKLSPVEVVTLGSTAVTPLEMAQAYSTFATGGVKRDAVVVTKIEDKNGNIIYEAADTSKRVLSEEVAGATTNVLKTVFTEGTARGASPSNGQTVAGKTGTSENYIDHWLVGYSPTLSCATWIGNPAGNIEGTSNITCNRLWHDFMSAALEDQPVVDFPAAEDPDYNNDFNKKQQITLGDPDPADAPSVVGMTLSDAQSALSDYTVSVVEEYSDTAAAGSVIGQSVQDDTIVLVVSKGPQPPTEPAQPDPDTPPPTEPDPPAENGTGGT
ncbi:transglycosylase domain-containing protein [Enteroscipio rubneri]|uniref:transglycosylase domain-containing protein n=1 Tax=Enteroscipio rubneri TaxID=2070686 RepID=UPI003AF09406